MRWSFGRPTTVRTRIVALALAPVLALMVLWSFAMVSVTGELRALVRVQGVYDDFGTPVDTAVGQIQIERRLAAAYLGADHGTAAALDLMEQQRRTDRAVTAMRTAIRDGDRGRLSARQRQVLDAVLRSFDGLEGLRERVLSRAISWDRAVTEYGALVEPGFDVQSALTALQAGQLAREAQVVIELVRVRSSSRGRTPSSPGREPPDRSPTASTTRSPRRSRTAGSSSGRMCPTFPLTHAPPSRSSSAAPCTGS